MFAFYLFPFCSSSACLSWYEWGYFSNWVPFNSDFEIQQFDYCRCDGTSCYVTWYSFHFSRSYKCQDAYNSYVPKGQHDGASFSTPVGKSTKTSVKLKFKYKTKVGNNDYCEVKKCKIYYDDSNSGWYSCEQNVRSGKYVSTSKSYKLKPGKHTYWIKTKAQGLFQKRMFRILNAI